MCRPVEDRFVTGTELTIIQAEVWLKQALQNNMTGARWYAVNSAIVSSQFDFKMVGSRRELSLKSAFLVF